MPPVLFCAVTRIRLPGTVRIESENADDIKSTRSEQLLFGYLVFLRHRSHTRDSLAPLFLGVAPDERARR